MRRRCCSQDGKSDLTVQLLRWQPAASLQPLKLKQPRLQALSQTQDGQNGLFRLRYDRLVPASGSWTEAFVLDLANSKCVAKPGAKNQLQEDEPPEYGARWVFH